jgi:ABC-2 type transport system permease protein
MNQLRWSIRRELWENRSTYIAPLLVTAFVFFGSWLSVISRASKQVLAMKPFQMAPAPIMMIAFVVGAFYSIDALYGERRDRSILFWKSMPVSDTTTVLSKAAVPMVVLPAVAYVLSAATLLGLVILSLPALIANGLSLARFWSELHLFEELAVMAYGLTVHSLWFAPLYAWLILISAWARRVPILWAVVPPLAAVALERITSGTAVRSLLGYRFAGAMREGFILARDGHVDEVTPLRFLTAPGLWLGLIAAATFLALAVRLRRYREPI